MANKRLTLTAARKRLEKNTATIETLTEENKELTKIIREWEETERFESIKKLKISPQALLKMSAMSKEEIDNILIRYSGESEKREEAFRNEE